MSRKKYSFKGHSFRPITEFKEPDVTEFLPKTDSPSQKTLPDIRPSICKVERVPLEDLQTHGVPQWIPKGISTNPLTNMELFEKECWMLTDYLKSKQNTHVRVVVFQAYKNLIEKFDSDCKVYMFGSSPNNLCIPDSDIDLVICTSAQLDREKQFKLLRKIAKKCCRGNFDVQVINARVPLLKFKDRESRYNIDISWNTLAESVQHVDLTAQMLKQLPGLRELVLIVKMFLNCRGLNSNAEQGIGGFCLIVWLASFLRVHEYLYASEPKDVLQIDWSPEAKPKISNNVQLGKTLLDFFHFFGYCYDYYNSALDVKLDSVFTYKVQLGDVKKVFKLSVYNPFKAAHDVGVNTHRADEVCSAFQVAYTELKSRLESKSLPLNEDGFLGRILHFVIPPGNPAKFSKNSPNKGKQPDTPNSSRKKRKKNTEMKPNPNLATPQPKKKQKFNPEKQDTAQKQKHKASPAIESQTAAPTPPKNKKRSKNKAKKGLKKEGKSTKGVQGSQNAFDNQVDFVSLATF